MQTHIHAGGALAESLPSSHIATAMRSFFKLSITCRLKWALALVWCCSLWGALLDDVICDLQIAEPRGTPSSWIDLLYWKTTGNGYDYRVEKEHVRTLKPEAHFGLRFGLSYSSIDCCDHLNVTGLYLRGRDRLPPLMDKVQPKDKERIDRFPQLIFQYGNAEVAAARTLGCFDLYAALRYADLIEKQRFREKKLAQRETTEEEKKKTWWEAVEEKEWLHRLRFWGVGPGVGLGACFPLCEGFTVSGRLSGFLLFGQRSTATDKFAFPHETAVVPALDLDLGIGYWQEVCNFTWSVELGFGLQHYFRAASPVLSLSDTAAESATRLSRGMGFGGPYAQLKVAY